MKQSFYNTLIISGSLMLSFSQIPIYESIQNTDCWGTPPGFLLTALFYSGTIPFIVLGCLLLLIGIIKSSQNK